MAAPEVVSSKKKPPRLPRIQGNTPKPRDPRFEHYAGEFSRYHFRQAYGFVSEIRHKELSDLQAQLPKIRNPEEREKTERAITVLKSQIATEKRKDQSDEAKREWRKKEKEMVRQGKKPYFHTRKREREEQLKIKYDSLKNEGQLEKYIAKKARRNTAKEHKFVPQSRINRETTKEEQSDEE